MATLTPKEVAARFGTDARTLRKFLRSETPVDERPGKGGRWALDTRSVKGMQKRFNAWNAAQIEARKAAAAERAAAENAENEEIVEDDA